MGALYMDSSVRFWVFFMYFWKLRVRGIVQIQQMCYSLTSLYKVVKNHVFLLVCAYCRCYRKLYLMISFPENKFYATVAVKKKKTTL